MQHVILVYLFIINFAAFVACGWDKRQARHGGRRVPERTLLILSALGGSPAFLLGMALFHHKTRKPKVIWGVPLLFATQVIAAWCLMRLL